MQCSLHPATEGHAVSALCDTEDGGCALLLPGGRVVVPDTMETVLQVLG